MYYITKDNPDGSKEKVAEIASTKENAFEEFEKIIREQCHEYHVTKTLKTWRVIRLFDENNKQLAQES